MELPEHEIDLALTSFRANHPATFERLRGWGGKEVTLHVDVDLNEEEQVELAVRRSLKGEARRGKGRSRYRF